MRSVVYARKVVARMLAVIALVVALWLLLVMFILSLLAVSARADSMMERHARGEELGQPPPRADRPPPPAAPWSSPTSRATSDIRVNHRHVVGGTPHERDRVRGTFGGEMSPRPSAAARGAEDLAALTSRERDVLELLATGARTRAIADDLGIAEPTVKRHLTNLYRKLGVTNRVQAVTRYLQQGRSHRRGRARGS